MWIKVLRLRGHVGVKLKRHIQVVGFVLTAGGASAHDTDYQCRGRKAAPAILTNIAIIMINRKTKIITTNKMIEIYQIQQSEKLKIKWITINNQTSRLLLRTLKK